jgi:hypothetical protein
MMALADDVARLVIDELWSDDFIFGVVETALMRPGRGRSARGSNRGGWRYEDRHDELMRFSRFVYELMESVRTRSLTAKDARLAVDAGPYAGFVLIADSKVRMVECLAERFRAGDTAWVHGYTEAGLPGSRVLHVRSWHDPSHRRIA